MEALLLVPALVMGLLLWRADRRYDASQRLLTATLDEWSDDRKALHAEMAKEREDWTAERAQLLNRIQRPDTAVYENFEPTSKNPYVGFDDDEAFHKAKGMSVDGDS